VAAFGQLDGLRDSGVCRYALHEQELRCAEAKQVEQVSVESHHAATNSGIEVRVEPGAASQGSVHQLSHPATIAGIETSRPAIERRIEHLTASEVGANVGGGDTRVGDSTAVMHGDAALPSIATGRTMVLTRPWHTS
jgi:hypothetical protein